MKKLSTSTFLQSPADYSFASNTHKLSFVPVKRILLAAILIIYLLPSSSIGTAKAFTGWVLAPEQEKQAATSSVTILVDDFKPQPFRESINPSYFYNRLNGDRGALYSSILNWDTGKVKVTVAPSQTYGGIWESLNHPDREHLPINFSAILPSQILPAYQSQITGMTVQIEEGTPGRVFKLELKDGGNIMRWNTQVNLSGGRQTINLALPLLGPIHSLNMFLAGAVAGDYVMISRISFTASTQITDPATKAFVWSYAMLLNNWNPLTGLVRDKAKDVSGEFDAIQVTGSLAAATALAKQLNIISATDATAIVNRIGDTLLNKVPRFHGLWPHFVTVSSTGVINIVNNQEWSSVDTVIAAIGLLDAQHALGLPTSTTEQMLRSIDWRNLVTQQGISHGYNFSGHLIQSVWDTFGGESWLAELGYTSSTSYIAHLEYSNQPTANGSGFIDELAWLFLLPPSAKDFWNNDWNSYRASAASTQIAYYPNRFPSSCFTSLDLFGLSAAEVPDQSLVIESNIYQPFGVGGQSSSRNDGSSPSLLGAPVVIPHYSAMIASLRPVESIKMWDWLINQGYFSPLNNVESLMFQPSSNCSPSAVVFNDLKGSWNLSLQTLGWGRYLVQQNGLSPSIWLATTQNSFLRNGYRVLTSRARVSVSIGGTTRGLYEVIPKNNMKISYAGLDNGPVKIISTNGIPIVASERVTYSPNGGSTWASFSELMGLPANQLTTSYMFPWYNNLDLNSQLRFCNMGNATTSVTATIGGVVRGSYPLTSNQCTRVSYSGLDSGPVKVTSSGGMSIIASLRVAYFDGSNWTSFTEMMGLPSNKLTASYIFPWYNNLDLNSQLRFGNVGTVNTTVTVTVGGAFKGSYNLAPNESKRVSYAGLDGGPVKVTSSGNVPIIASLRVAYNNGSAWTNFSEMMGLPANTVGTHYSFPIYNNADLNTQLRFGNVGNANTTVTVAINGLVKGTYNLAPSQSQRVSYAGVIGGPVVIQSSGGVPIIASERVAYFNGSAWTSFAEMMGLPQSQLTTTYLFPWYNNVDINSQLRFGVP